MNATVANFASHSFSSYASRNIRVDEDRNGLFCQVPDKSGRWYTVRCVESKKSVYASHCNCSTFAKHQACGHIDTVQAYWNKLYPQKVEAPKVAKARKPRNGLVRKVRNGGLVRVEQKATKSDVKATVTVDSTSAKTTDVGNLGNLNVSRAFSIMR